MRRDAWLAFASTRAALIVIGYVVLTAFPPNPVESWQGIVFPDNKWIDGLVRWDSMWYEAIVNNTSRFLPSGHSSANFFPLYSWLSWLVSLPLRFVLDPERAFYAAGFLVSAVSFLLALIAVARLATRLAGAEVAVRAVWLIAVFPFSFFLTAVYADALYFCLAAWSLALAYEQRWRGACTLATFAAMTRIPGLALYPAIVLEYLRRHDFDPRSLRKEIPALAILAIGPLVLGGYYFWRYGHPLAFLHARQQGWNRASGFTALQRDYRYFFSASLFSCGSFTECVREFEPTRKLLGLWYVALVPISLGLLMYARRTLGVGLTVWAAFSVLMALVNGLDGTGRFTAVLFPVFIAMAMLLRSRTAFLAVCVVFVPFLILFFAQFARWKQVL
jgi:Mannosyltransferase (PIG-V)